MEENHSLKILKNAILLEKRGKAFYQKVADDSPSPAIKSFFEMMAGEEEKHIQVLGDQFKFFRENKSFMPGDYPDAGAIGNASEILNRELQEKIASAGFESAGISAAVSMEERAVRLYGEQARNAKDPEEKRLYAWLAKWEQGHLKILLDMDRQLTEKIWNDNRFWPF